MFPPQRSPTVFAAILLALSAPSIPVDAAPDTLHAHKAKKDQAQSQEEPIEISDEIDVRGRTSDLTGIAMSANEGATSRIQLEKRPIQRPGDLVESAPGVVATQHSGGGKANQFFLRGFNLDHGTDFTVSVADVPVNFPSHGHGQGYTDLNFLIPEMISTVQYRKGPYFAGTGDFSAAGSLDIDLVESLPRGLLKVTGGDDDFGRVLWADSWRAGSNGGRWVTAIDIFQEDGPWTRGDDYDGFKAFARYSGGDANRGYNISLLSYDANWLSTDQIPRRAVDSGLIDRFDLIDAGPRGSTTRHSLSASVHRATDKTLTYWRAYLLGYDFSLISNFTYFLEDPVDGDQFEQMDERWVFGGEFRHHWSSQWGKRRIEHEVGFDLRYDDISNGLFRTRELSRLATVREDDIRQASGGLFAESLIPIASKMRARLGLRADYLDVDVESDRAINSGKEDDLLVSPKVTLIFGPWNGTEIYLNYGEGFHSNDARGATLRVDPVSGEPASPVDLLVRARGADLGVRLAPRRGWQMTLTYFALELDSELLFVGDGGATEASRPSRRRGVEWTNFWQVDANWAIDLDVTLTDAEFTDFDPAGDAIPGSIEETLAAGVTYDSQAWFGSLRWRYFGDVPLIEDGSVIWRSSSVLNGRFGHRFSESLELAVELFNLLDTEESDIEYFYASRLPGEPAGGIEDVHFHPRPPRSARLALTWRY